MKNAKSLLWKGMVLGLALALSPCLVFAAEYYLFPTADIQTQLDRVGGMATNWQTVAVGTQQNPLATGSNSQYVWTITDATDIYEMSDMPSSVTSATIQSVQVSGYGWPGWDQINSDIILGVGLASQNYSGEAIDYVYQATTAPQWYSTTFTSSPFTSSAWTLSEINSLRGVLRIYLANPNGTNGSVCQAYYIKVTYTDTTQQNPPDSGGTVTTSGLTFPNDWDGQQYTSYQDYLNHSQIRLWGSSGPVVHMSKADFTKLCSYTAIATAAILFGCLFFAII